MSALHEQFVTEARELIRQATDDLIVLERDGASPERIDRVFRAFHTLKGSAGVVELPAMGIMLHAAEDLLASVRQGVLGGGPDIIDAALACLDQVSRWVDDFEASGALSAQAGEDGRILAQRLRSFLRRGEPAAAGIGRSAINGGSRHGSAGMGGANDRGGARRNGVAAAKTFVSRVGDFVPADRGLLLQRRRSPAADAAGAQPAGPSYRTARGLCASGGYRSLCLQSAPAGDFRRRP